MIRVNEIQALSRHATDGTRLAATPYSMMGCENGYLSDCNPVVCGFESHSHLSKKKPGACRAFSFLHPCQLELVGLLSVRIHDARELHSHVLAVDDDVVRRTDLLLEHTIQVDRKLL